MSDSNKQQQRLYASLNKNLLGARFGGSAAEAHGIASALCCRGVASAALSSAASLSAESPSWVDKFNLSDSISLVGMQSLMEMTLRQLKQSHFGFALWLPQDVELILEANALSQWCSGFIIALLHDNVNLKDTLSTTAAEAFDDIVQIAELEHTADGEVGQTLAANEEAFFAIAEHVRISVQLLFEEMHPH